ncbi:O-antigen ligase family protein [Patescibacteria group bacterium]|nr:O-antigen ligase family protein [Patescibacteria group bacterium]MCL5010183.1 O-antigen ligase family protein [Patescibacteria group bacterium]
MKRYGNRLSGIVFYLILLFLPTQLGKHFWPHFAIIRGIRVDYLSPTLYFTDLLIILLFLAVAAEGILLKKKEIKVYAARLFSLPFVLFILILIIGILFSKSRPAGAYGLFRFLEFWFFGVFAAGFIKTKKRLKTIVFIFSLGVIFEGTLSVLQYLNQGSLGGILYFLGERYFNGQTPGIANASINGALFLRPYATFPHPNVLAAYLLLSMILLIFGLRLYASYPVKIFLSAAAAIGSFSLLLTLSRAAIFLWFAFLLFYGFRLSRKKIKGGLKIFYFFFVFALVFFILVSPLRFRFSNLSLSSQSIVGREVLDQDAFLMFVKHPLFGVGLNNYFINMPQGEENPTFLFQPPHNIFLLILSETGILGLAFSLWFIAKTYRKISAKTEKDGKILNLGFLLLSAVLVLGMFDHYFLTLEQGQLMLSFVLGLSWSGPYCLIKNCYFASNRCLTI